jgi:hypothetical protein
MLDNAKQFVEKRLFNLGIPERMKFFLALQKLAKYPDRNNLGKLQMSEMAKENMNSGETFCLAFDSKSLIADLILIGIDKNKQHVRAVASNYRHNRVMPSLPDLPTGEIPLPNNDEELGIANSSSYPHQ